MPATQADLSIIDDVRADGPPVLVQKVPGGYHSLDHGQVIEQTIDLGRGVEGYVYGTELCSEEARVWPDLAPEVKTIASPEPQSRLDGRATETDSPGHLGSRDPGIDDRARAPESRLLPGE